MGAPPPRDTSSRPRAPGLSWANPNPPTSTAPSSVSPPRHAGLTPRGHPRSMCGSTGVRPPRIRGEVNVGDTSNRPRRCACRSSLHEHTEARRALGPPLRHRAGGDRRACEADPGGTGDDTVPPGRKPLPVKHGMALSQRTAGTSPGGHHRPSLRNRDGEISAGRAGQSVKQPAPARPAGRCPPARSRAGVSVPCGARWHEVVDRHAACPRTVRTRLGCRPVRRTRVPRPGPLDPTGGDRRAERGDPLACRAPARLAHKATVGSFLPSRTEFSAGRVAYAAAPSPGPPGSEPEQPRPTGEFCRRRSGPRGEFATPCAAATRPRPDHRASVQPPAWAAVFLPRDGSTIPSVSWATGAAARGSRGLRGRRRTPSSAIVSSGSTGTRAHGPRLDAPRTSSP